MQTGCLNEASLCPVAKQRNLLVTTKKAEIKKSRNAFVSTKSLSNC